MWEIRAFTGRSPAGTPTQVSRTVRGTKKEALRVAAELTVAPAGRAAGRSVAEVLEAWVRKHDATWAPASRRDQLSRIARINGDRIARLSVARLTIEDVERWHTRLRDDGLADVSIRNVHGVLRAALTQAVRWGWVTPRGSFGRTSVQPHLRYARPGPRQERPLGHSACAGRTR